MFIGLAPWPSNEPTVECVLESGQSVDLHNCSDFRRLVLQTDRTLRLDFHILHEHIFGPSLLPNDTLRLTFEGVEDLHVHQLSQTKDEDRGLFEHLLFSEADFSVELVFEIVSVTMRFTSVQAELLEIQS